MKDICETIAEISFLLKKKGFKKQKLKFYEINDQFIKVIQIQNEEF